MRKIYLLVYSDEVGSRERVKQWADSSPCVITWRYDLPNCFYIISEQPAKDISESFEAAFGLSRHLVIEIADHYWGRLHQDTWYLIETKTHKPKEP